MWRLTVCTYVIATAMSVPCQTYSYNTEKECNDARKTLPNFSHGYAVCSVEIKKEGKQFTFIPNMLYNLFMFNEVDYD